ncbi:hypothetical protein DICSQDRAFT_175820 [Dichomitus squalens LYAD-421 SS1]|uniref:DUF6532 domain-containing protein n=1 Tax=Dichomitus squalens (strain LYAD-421) TaxID=732165 RepID=R7SIF8_DICSQ|nr:uncharacterized protein DICSQDRAFT_175820 [Dichomitus squalens LYAD-421 SS1]EJF55510.1 hypothetical protein DICSQDRAFT_175820 [Dichomitus squalens LYAD-421 SS1]
MAHDYVDDIKGLLIEARSYYSCYLFTEELFPGPSKQREFVIRAWNATCAACETLPLYALSERMIRIIGARKSSVFDISMGRKEKYSEHALIGRSLEIALFPNTRTGLGFMHPEFFDPIPDQLLAFLHTVIHAHICEWSTGRHIREDFTATKNETFYIGFLADLRSYGSKNPSAWLNIRKRMYSRAFQASGGAKLQAQTTRISTAAIDAAQAELEGRTGLTDSEDEGEVGATVA